MLGWLTPRILIAAGVPLERWATSMGGAISVDLVSWVLAASFCVAGFFLTPFFAAAWEARHSPISPRDAQTLHDAFGRIRAASRGISPGNPNLTHAVLEDLNETEVIIETMGVKGGIGEKAYDFRHLCTVIIDMRRRGEDAREFSIRADSIAASMLPTLRKIAAKRHTGD